MTLILSGTDGLSDVDGSAATPAIRGTDTNTGIFFPAADTIAFSQGGVESMRINSSGNVGIGTASPSSYTSGDQLVVASTSGNGQMTLAGADNANPTLQFRRVSSPSTVRGFIQYDNTSEWMRFATNGSERMRIDSSGNLLVGGTSMVNAGKALVQWNSSSGVEGLILYDTDSTAVGRFAQKFNRNGTVVGSIQTTLTATVYVTSSDYRLKENIAPMSGALDKVAQLKPCTYKWNSDGSDGQGFIAHELAEVVPDCVVGEKDAVDAEGNPQYQGIDTSFLVATLTAAIQEQQAIITQLQADVASLKGTS